LCPIHNQKVMGSRGRGKSLTILFVASNLNTHFFRDDARASLYR
jgi:Cdc6-like AAA superfamily ATPase